MPRPRRSGSRGNKSEPSRSLEAWSDLFSYDAVHEYTHLTITGIPSRQVGRSAATPLTTPFIETLVCGASAVGARVKPYL
jgi:hypothetical protein